MLKLSFINQGGISDDLVFITAYSDSANPYDVRFQDTNGETQFDK